MMISIHNTLASPVTGSIMLSVKVLMCALVLSTVELLEVIRFVLLVSLDIAWYQAATHPSAIYKSETVLILSHIAQTVLLVFQASLELISLQDSRINVRKQNFVVMLMKMIYVHHVLMIKYSPLLDR